MIDAIQDVTVEELQNFSEQLVKQLYLEFLFDGNATKEEALACVEMIENELKCKELIPEQFFEQRVFSLEEGKSYLYQKEGANPENTNTALNNYFQLGLETWPKIAMLGILCHILKEPAFNILRTQEQLGYIVFSGQQTNQGVIGWRVIVQSERDPTFLDERVEAFISTVPSLLEKMTEEEWEHNKNALIALKLEKDKTLNKQSTRYWLEITSHTYVFDRAEKEAIELRLLQKNEVVAFWNEYIAKDAPRRKKLSVQLFGKGHAVPTSASDNVSRITDIAAFKRSASLFPFQPAL